MTSIAFARGGLGKAPEPPLEITYTTVNLLPIKTVV
jgi:hypothetical protein